jgi:catechol 2,3-dioxygenase-like lactoylglutathione lyase family enzyme
MLRRDDIFSSFAAPDLEAIRTFYRDVVNLDVGDDGGMVWIGTGGGKRVLVYPKPDHQPATFTVLNLPADDVEAAVDELTAKGVRFEQYGGELQTDAKGIMRGNGPDIAWFKDPAGNIVSVIAAG